LYGITLTLALILAFPTSPQAKEEGRPDKAMCSVCAIRGETEEEKVKAHAEHDGKAYYFCSKDCRKVFDADPLAYIPPQLPRPAPQFSVETLVGESVDLGRYEDKLVVLDFWATWCKPCVDMMPSLQRLYDSYSEKGLVVLGVSIDEDKDRVKKIRKFVDKVGVSYPIFSDARPTPAWHTFKVKAIPALFLIDRDGQIVAQWLGNVDHQAVEAEIKKHLQ
jgi:thiol-disulfide isomerase/thioredoxin